VTDPREIAEGLDERTRKALGCFMGPVAYVYTRDSDDYAYWEPFPCLTVEQMSALHSVGLVTIDGRAQAHLTPLGRQVAAHLEEDKK
jgi:hypothetical protein